MNEFGRNLFWSPTCGVSEYEVDARESGGDRADYRGGITCPDTWERCDYLLDEDQRTSEAFRAAPELRVRAVNASGKGPWSEWVSSVRRPTEAPTISSLIEIHDRFSHNDVKVNFSNEDPHLVASNRLEWRYIEYHDDIPARSAPTAILNVSERCLNGWTIPRTTR